LPAATPLPPPPACHPGNACSKIREHAPTLRASSLPKMLPRLNREEKKVSYYSPGHLQIIPICRRRATLSTLTAPAPP
jgi:hypothetical protein